MKRVPGSMPKIIRCCPKPESAILSKSIKIALNYLLGGLLSAGLLWVLYLQAKAHTKELSLVKPLQEGITGYLVVAILLLALNIGLEVRRWRLLAGSVLPVSVGAAWRSVLGGLALSFVTPNRIGDYPGRILLLKGKKNARLLSVTILGACAQLLAVLVMGMVGLIYFNLTRPGLLPLLVLLASVGSVVVTGLFYFRFERWAPMIENMRWLRRLRLYGHAMQRNSEGLQWQVLQYSLLRCAVYVLQFYLMLRWVQVPVPLLAGCCLCALFFWVMAVVPSVPLAELGVRGNVSLFLFKVYTVNAWALLSATVAIWLVNLLVPAIIGSLLLWRMRVWKV